MEPWSSVIFSLEAWSPLKYALDTRSPRSLRWPQIGNRKIYICDILILTDPINQLFCRRFTKSSLRHSCVHSSKRTLEISSFSRFLRDFYTFKSTDAFNSDGIRRSTAQVVLAVEAPFELRGYIDKPSMKLILLLN